MRWYSLKLTKVWVRDVLTEIWRARRNRTEFTTRCGNVRCWENERATFAWLLNCRADWRSENWPRLCQKWLTLRAERCARPQLGHYTLRCTRIINVRVAELRVKYVLDVRWCPRIIIRQNDVQRRRLQGGCSNDREYRQETHVGTTDAMGRRTSKYERTARASYLSCLWPFAKGLASHFPCEIEATDARTRDVIHHLPRTWTAVFAERSTSNHPLYLSHVLSRLLGDTCDEQTHVLCLKGNQGQGPERTIWLPLLDNEYCWEDLVDNVMELEGRRVLLEWRGRTLTTNPVISAIRMLLSAPEVFEEMSSLLTCWFAGFTGVPL